VSVTSCVGVASGVLLRTDVVADATLRWAAERTIAWLQQRLAEVIAGQAVGQLDRSL